MRMLAVAGCLEPGNDLRASSCGAVATVLLYTSGLRLGELLRLRVEDIEDGGTVLQIRESKFHKSRIVPLSDSTRIESAPVSQAARHLRLHLAGFRAFLCNRYRGELSPYSAPVFTS